MDEKTSIQHSLELPQSKPDYVMCLFTDASDGHWGATLTQTHPDQLGLPIPAFLSGSLTKTQLRWSVIEKETFPIIEATDRFLHFLLFSNELTLFTDHHNLVYVLNPWCYIADAAQE